MKGLKTNNETGKMEVTCDCCAHTEEIEVDHSDMDSLMNASSKINELFRVKGDTHLCNKNCGNIRFSQLDQSF